MPVNEKNGNGELLEQGWRQMQGILDLEMPQNRNKKWGLWIPISIVGIALIITALMYFNTDMVNDEVPVKQANPHQSFALTEQENASRDEALLGGSRAPKSNALSSVDAKDFDSDKNFGAVKEDQALNTSGGSTEITVVSGDDKIEVQSTTENVIVSSGTEEVVVSSGTEEVVVSSGTEEVVVPSGTEEVVVPSGTEEVVVPSGTEVVALSSNADLPPTSLNHDKAVISMAGMATQQDVDMPATIDVVAPGSLNYQPAAQPIIPVATQIKPKVGLEVFGAPHFVSNVELRGVEAGALATVTLGRKWKLLAGASYGHYDNNGLINPGGQSSNLDVETFAVPVVVDTSTFSNPNADPEIAYNKIGYDTAQLLSEKFNYLHFPVLAQYRVGRFISVTGGLKVSYLINAPSDKNLSATPLNSSQGYPLDLNNSSNFLVEEDILRKWDIAPVIGVAFDMGRRIAFDLQYQHGLIPYVDRPTDSDRSDYHRTVSLGLRYRIL